jgi:hypothetical protein
MAQVPTVLQQNRCLSELVIVPPQMSPIFGTYTNPIVLPFLTPPVDPDAKEDGDENKPEDVPAAAEANVVRVPDGTGTTSSSMIVSPAKSTGVLKESISVDKEKYIRC